MAIVLYGRRCSLLLLLLLLYQQLIVGTDESIRQPLIYKLRTTIGHCALYNVRISCVCVCVCGRNTLRHSGAARSGPNGARAHHETPENFLHCYRN